MRAIKVTSILESKLVRNRQTPMKSVSRYGGFLKICVHNYYDKKKQCFIEYSLRAVSGVVVLPLNCSGGTAITIWGSNYIWGKVRQQQNTCPKVGKIKNRILPPVITSLGLKQGDNLSPLLFGLFLDDVERIFDNNCDPVTILPDSGSLKHLLFVDDMALI